MISLVIKQAGTARPQFRKVLFFFSPTLLFLDENCGKISRLAHDIKWWQWAVVKHFSIKTHQWSMLTGMHCINTWDSTALHHHGRIKQVRCESGAASWRWLKIKHMFLWSWRKRLSAGHANPTQWSTSSRKPTQGEIHHYLQSCDACKSVSIWPETCHLLATCSFTSQARDSRDPRCSTGRTPLCECGKDESGLFGCSLPMINKNGKKLLWASRVLGKTLEKRRYND